MTYEKRELIRLFKASTTKDQRKQVPRRKLDIPVFKPAAHYLSKWVHMETGS